MKIKIVNKRKLVTKIVGLIGIIIIISIFANNVTLSHTETKYKKVYITSGDTLWNIAKEEKENNAYYLNKDIRSIVDDIKNLNKLSSSDLSINQELRIPCI